MEHALPYTATGSDSVMLPFFQLMTLEAVGSNHTNIFNAFRYYFNTFLISFWLRHSLLLKQVPWTSLLCHQKFSSLILSGKKIVLYRAKN